MKTNKRASKSDKNSSIINKINDFVTLNTFAIFLLILAVWFHQIFVVGATINKLEKNQDSMVRYLRDNVNKVYFLSASGLVLSAKKGEISYADERFKSYLSNELISSFVGGNIEISSNYKITFDTPSSIIRNSKKIGQFYQRFVQPHQKIMAPFARSLHHALVEGMYPEYINVISHQYIKYRVEEPSEENGFHITIKASMAVRLLVKSWIRDLKSWDTREVPITVKFQAIVDVGRYANMSNPFGVHFTGLDFPVIHKPTGFEIRESKK